MQPGQANADQGPYQQLGTVRNAFGMIAGRKHNGRDTYLVLSS
jgi:hypothetical protein